MRRAGRTSRREAGFTLVEMMAALFIAGLVAALVVLSMPEPESEAEQAAERFADALQRAAEEAVISGDAIGVRVDSRGYAFARWRGGVWVEARAARPRPWPDGLVVGVDSDAVSRAYPGGLDEDDVPPLIRFDSTGGAEPFRVDLRGAEGRFVVTGDAAGAIALERLDG